MDDNIVNLPYSDQSWKVKIRGRVYKSVQNLPIKVQLIWMELIMDLKTSGPVQYQWPNYSKLDQKRFHCHLNYRYVAVWVQVDKVDRTLEVTYVGSREKAPY